MNLTDEKLRNVIILVASCALILSGLGGAALIGWLFATGQAVNVILIGFVSFALGQMFNMVSHALGFNQGVSVSPAPLPLMTAPAAPVGPGVSS